MKLYKLIVHQKGFSDADLIINPKEFPHLKIGEIVEIYHPDDDFSRLLLQITSFKEDLQGRETFSVEQSIASTFQLRVYNDVYLNKVAPETVALDSVEVTFKDQYLGRSEMWRLRNNLVNTCVYLNKKIEYCGGSIRCQVYEMWAAGERVACGVISEDTKVVFRSSTSMVYLFLQMSSEMWDFDVHGDLYFEKAVNGFLSDLFKKWKSQKSNHEVTIVLFSRTFYKAESIHEFPEHMRECLQQDYKGRYYEDFYRVAVQNERYDEWTPILALLRQLFTNYQKMVLEYHHRTGIDYPPAVNSTAAQGNFLEVLNMSLNVFEKHYLDRSLDRTGQLSVVLTPGVGVFEVDRALTSVTKQRVIDNGVGSDLVCVGEQPLHAVPLLKFHSKDTSLNDADDFSMPHWINLSFYSTNKKVAYSSFIPRIKLPPVIVSNRHSYQVERMNSHSSSVSSTRAQIISEQPAMIPTTEKDYDAYDDQVFTLPSNHIQGRQKTERSKKISLGLSECSSDKVWRRKMSDSELRCDISYSSSVNTTASQAVIIPQVHSRDTSPYPSSSLGPNSIAEILRGTNEDDSPPPRLVVGSASPTNSPIYLPHISQRPSRSLINPFDPSHVTIKMTSNRRRWTHIFPKGPTGVLIQQHHYQAVPSQCIFDSSYQNSDPRHPPFSGLNHPRLCSRLFNSINSVSGNKKLQTLLWGATGEQEWTPALTTGVDWKSLTIPACLPITTDYFPDEICLKTDYVFSDYTLLPDDVNADFAQQRSSEKKSLSTKEVFYELVSQRLAQGFQLIIDSESHIPDRGSAVIGPRSNSVTPSLQIKLSIGRVFHRIVLNGSEIRVTRYRPRHPYSPFVIHYRYRFQAPDHKTYGVSWVSFNTEKLENFNWNYLDHYICTRGDTDFAFVEALKYWRFRIYVLPLSQITTRKILDGSETCDLYTPIGIDEQHSLKDGFLKFIENWVNRTRKTVKPSPKPDLSQLNTNSQLTRRRHSTGIMYLSKPQTVGQSSPFRERLGSNRVLEKPRPRSGSKVLERGRVSPATDVTPLPLNNVIDPDSTSETSENMPTEIEAPPLPKTATIPEIIEAMKTPSTGLDFLTGYSYLPSYTFVVFDALLWLSSRLERGMSQTKGVEFMEKLRQEGLICHASGDRSHPFLFGFYIFYFTQKDKGNDGPLDAAAFENEWVEVEAKQPHPPPEVPLFLQETMTRTCQFDTTSKRGAPLYKQAYLDISTNSRSDRVEWGHVRYHSAYRPDRAYELAIQWVAASGAIVSDLILGWARKIQSCGLQMVPIPADPLALPYSLKSDPLRGPVFVPLDLECLMGARSYLFEEFAEDSWAERLVLFQEAVAVKFGFITCTIENGSRHHHNQYIHLSGNAFLLIPAAIPCEYSSQTQPRTSSISRRSTRQYPVCNDLSTSPHQEYISRHVYSSGDDFKQETRVGFLWAWNHMVSRRWKWSSTPATCDEAFQNKILGDFQKFCANTDNRLKLFWDHCWFVKKNQAAS